MDKQYYEQYTREALIEKIVERDEIIDGAIDGFNEFETTLYKFRIALSLLAHRARFIHVNEIREMNDGAFIGLGRLGYVVVTVNKGVKTKVGGNIAIEDVNFLMRLPTKEQSQFLKEVVKICQNPTVSDEEMFAKPWFKTFKENFKDDVSDPFADEEGDINFDPNCSCCDAEDCQNRTAPYIGGGDDED